MVFLDENKNSLTVIKDAYHEGQMVHIPSLVKSGKHHKYCPKQKPDFYFKLILLGDASSGKTSLAKRYQDHTWVSEDTMTGSRMGSNEYMDSVTECSGKTVFVRLYDTAGKYELLIMFVDFSVDLICFLYIQSNNLKQRQ